MARVTDTMKLLYEECIGESAIVPSSDGKPTGLNSKRALLDTVLDRARALAEFLRSVEPVVAEQSLPRLDVARDYS